VANLTQKDGERTTRYGFIDGGSPYNLFKPAFAAALEQENRDAAAQKLASDLDWYASLASRRAIPALDIETGYARLQELIGSGQSAMWMDDLGYLAERRDQANKSVMAVPFPVSADDSAAPTGPGYGQSRGHQRRYGSPPGSLDMDQLPPFPFTVLHSPGFFVHFFRGSSQTEVFS
jgi:hypothetical protein